MELSKERWLHLGALGMIAVIVFATFRSSAIANAMMVAIAAADLALTVRRDRRRG